MSQDNETPIRKRKADSISRDPQEIEVDLNAPEPPSKKSLRKAKKAKSTKISDSTSGKIDAKLSEGQERLDEDQDIATSTTNPRSKTKTSEKSDAAYAIWIGNLAFFTTRDDLTAFFTRPETEINASDITRINLPKGTPRNGKTQNKGFAYVDFATSEAQKAAIALSEKLLGGRRVLIKDAKSYEGRPEKPQAETASSVPPSKRIFVGNLSFDVATDDLRNHFAQCGPIEHVHMATFEDSGKCKGYAWVTYQDLSSAEAAMRGWVEVVDEERDVASGDEANEDVKGRRRSQKRRVNVGKLWGRKLRMEFAEDPTTRYKKRFGKNPGDKESNTDDVGIEDVQGPALRINGETGSIHNNGKGGEAVDHDQFKAQGFRRQRKENSTRTDTSRYGQSTVQRLTGAVVESQGKKITFD
ncbi:putative rna binding protein [Phaeomoniella chlamydospora]|uniref:Putative rna binding protein n=1 Tax=Phaeomoniella chlamydospora TaxID=158046 RepID=A0A0G2HFS8_PHACM|nr:putative rna binding protein [Phaeomoniella chlamydospora]